MSEIDSKPFPKAPLIGAALLVGSTIALAGSISLGILPKPATAVSERAARPVMSDASAVAIVMPALGPSLGMAPAGTCT